LICNVVPLDVTALLQTVTKHLKPEAISVLWPGKLELNLPILDYLTYFIRVVQDARPSVTEKEKKGNLPERDFLQTKR
jgi:hypothetical protein